MGARKWVAPLLALVCTILTRPSYAATGSIGGTVLDPTQAQVAGASVSIRSEGTGAQRRTETNELGYYIVPLLPPGFYEIQASKPGFQTAVRTAIHLRVDEVLQVDIALALEGQATSVDVSGLDSGDTALGQVIGRREVTDLPLNQRNFLAFALLAPGVTPPAYGSFSAMQGGAVHISGGREQSNQFLLEGIDNNDPRLNQVSLAPPIEAIDQFKIQSANSSVEFGRLAAGQIDMVLKSGTNSVHGSLLGFVRNRHLDARNYFARPACRPESVPGECDDKPALDRSQFGGSVGGPLVKNRAFYFATYEGLRLRQGVTRQSTVPSLNQRLAVLDQVPVQERNPAGLATLALYPLPNVRPDDPSSNAYVASPLIRDSTDQVLAKLDYRLAANSTLSGHYALFDQRRTEPYEPTSTFTNLPGFPSRTPKRSQHVAVGLTQAPDAYTVLQTRFGWHAPRYQSTHQSQGQDLNASLGYRSIATDPLYFGHPSIVIAGFESIGEGVQVPIQTKAEVFHAVQNVSIQPGSWAGRHLFRLGGSFRHVRQFRGGPLYARGLWNFFGNASQDPLESLVRGLVSNVLAGRGNNVIDLRTWSYDLHFSDDLRIGRRFTLQAGVRYEFNRPPTNAGPPLTVPDLRPESADCTPKPACLLVPGSSLGLPASTYWSDRNNFGPRVGLAWRPAGFDSLVIRAAYGISYENASLGVMNPYSYNPPLFSLSVYPNNGDYRIQTILDQQPLSGLALVYRVDPTFHDPYVQQWNFNLQFALSEGMVLETAYVGSKGTGLSGGTDPNQPPEGGGPRPFPQYGPIASIESRASSSYQAMQVRLERRFRQNSSFLAAYTWGKSIDDASLHVGLAQAESLVPQDSRSRQGERALSTFQTAHRLSLSYLQELPSLAARRGLIRGLLGNWQLGLIGSFNTGQPLTILRQIDQSGTGAGPKVDSLASLVYFERGESLRGLEYARRAVANAPGDGDAHFRLGLLYSALGFYESAMAENEKSVTADLPHLEALASQVWHLSTVGKFAEAEAGLQQLSAFDAESIGLPIYVHYIDILRGRYEKARELYETDTRMKSRGGEAFWQIGVALARAASGETEVGRAVLQKYMPLGIRGLSDIILLATVVGDAEAMAKLTRQSPHFNNYRWVVGNPFIKNVKDQKAFRDLVFDLHKTWEANLAKEGDSLPVRPPVLPEPETVLAASQ